mmetsp:Transcript_12222/g.20272  ORF Transcript_12222/g.20272 Transcript_12222/m.20272 type:complete len:125 (+) Transcript_12222:183-557(+)|eukprot:CAMPEP_0174956804 /NCGR_PEP_ID=MMETSP0004_2-20121128/1727_1 /TAXON_ID=420556 /ORGANISM="Ochromonas sp., Strain CCMP1393" /LENGTH=124 /DNA_ID=CAMNT_0016204857 /DNA_START=184 /DNA_END=558 /DNA_ORIENTATION=+
MADKTLNWDEALNQVGGDEEFLTEVLEDLLEEARTAEEEINEAIAAKDFSQLTKAAHRIKGSASYLCCENLRVASLNLQELGHNGTQPGANEERLLEEIYEWHRTFQDCLRDLRAEVERGLPRK